MSYVRSRRRAQILKAPQALGLGVRGIRQPGTLQGYQALGFGMVRGQGQIRAGRTSLGATTAFSSLASSRLSASKQTSTVPWDPTGYCTPDGQFIWDVASDGTSYLRRLKPTDVCKGIYGQNTTVTVHNPDGSTTTTYPDGHTETTPGATDPLCPGPAPAISATPPSDGITVDLAPVVYAYTTAAIPGDGKIPINFLLASTENTPVTYYLCGGASSNPLALTSLQRDVMLALLVAASKTFYWSDNDTIPSGDLIKGWTRGGDIKKAVVAGRRPLASFKLPDGSTKDLYVQMGFDQGMNTFSLFWAHHPSAFETIDNFVTKISPFDPAPLLCQMLPVATKVPNPYVAAGSIVLQLSGKCPPSCPPGMSYDSAAKTCSCPPGLVPNPTTQRCETPQQNAMSKLLVPALLFGGAALLIITLNKKKATSP